MPIASETELYAPIKRFLEGQGYTVRGEVNHCDVVAVRGDEPPVIVELKKTFTVPLLVQGIERLGKTDSVYVAIERKEHGRAPHQLAWSDLAKLCRRLGLGLLTVRFYKRKPPVVDVVCHPEPYVPRKNSRQTAVLLKEFGGRSGDYNVGGSTKRKVVTAYREKALHCAWLLRQHGPMTPRALREATANPNAASVLQKNYYRWFVRVERGLYALSPAGERAMEEYAHVIKERAAGGRETGSAGS
ncbi:hypothetical protein J31TS4_19370 [Paenibacillus sp. J31TS4]|uniref:DUF2161 domain-containing phosphodiesterase n=1 Tax=Paenibacillus sp. J31TS4 TaxID=2807195 RepID=UPI001B15ECCF|nr:DUF2161 family putative PD-(D/E)XK-type phosphodiesterase [Paenibacillus sp. J31TS4]GIP38657.1 hypothetical protein J31TS4_19370 [Paenibacillus sp. J31TS4]